jgi:sRNA-binding protein
MADDNDVLDQLIAKFPACFFRKNHERKPLMIGIRDRILAEAPELAPIRVAQALARYCGSHGYLWACTVEDVSRIDLTGAPVGVITGKDVANAKAMLAGKAKCRNGTALKARPQNGAGRPVEKPDQQQDQTVASKATDRAGRMTLVGLKMAAAARKMQA